MTTRDFDAEREQRMASLDQPTFRMRGRTFTVRDDVDPNVIMMFELLGNRDSGKSQGEQMQLVDDVMLGLVQPKDAEAYREMRAPGQPDAPGLMELISAATWCLEQITSRPFEPSSGSTTSATDPSSPDTSTEQPLRVVVGESGVSASGTGAT